MSGSALSDPSIQVEDSRNRLLGLCKGWLARPSIRGDHLVEVKFIVFKGKKNLGLWHYWLPNACLIQCSLIKGLTLDSIQQLNLLLLSCLTTTIHSLEKPLSSWAKSIISITLVFVFLELWVQHDNMKNKIGIYWCTMWACNLHFSTLEGLLNSFIHSTWFVKKLKVYNFT